jgi:hypothetical protein
MRPLIVLKNRVSAYAKQADTLILENPAGSPSADASFGRRA